MSSNLRRDVRVEEASLIADQVRMLRLSGADGQDLPAWQPGAHIDLILPSGLIRQYSLCGTPEDLSSYSIAVLREENGRGASREVHDALEAGSQLQIVGPRNRFPLHPSPRYLFVAGGIGITPILPMIHEAVRQGSDWRLIYGGRSRSTMAFLDQLAGLAGGVDILPQDEYGLLDLDTLLAPTPDTTVYCCGPEPLLEAVTERCARDWPAGRLQMERFTAAGVEATPPTEDADAFEVQIGRDGPVLKIGEGQTILSVLQDAGVDVLYSCEEGTCGSCETRVLAGEPTHRDQLLTEDERADGLMLICVSRSDGPRLVLDLKAP